MQTPNRAPSLFSPGGDNRPQFRCPFCGSTRPPEYSERLSVGGWIVLIAMLFLCFPLAWLCVFFKDKIATCSTCKIVLGK